MTLAASARDFSIAITKFSAPVEGNDFRGFMGNVPITESAQSPNNLRRFSNCSPRLYAASTLSPTAWAGAKRLAKIQFMRLRHTAIVRLAEAGRPDGEIAAITGHSLVSIKQNPRRLPGANQKARPKRPAPPPEERGRRGRIRTNRHKESDDFRCHTSPV